MKTMIMITGDSKSGKTTLLSGIGQKLRKVRSDGIIMEAFSLSTDVAYRTKDELYPYLGSKSLQPLDGYESFDNNSISGSRTTFRWGLPLAKNLVVGGKPVGRRMQDVGVAMRAELGSVAVSTISRIGAEHTLKANVMIIDGIRYDDDIAMLKHAYPSYTPIVLMVERVGEAGADDGRRKESSFSDIKPTHVVKWCSHKCVCNTVMQAAEPIIDAYVRSGAL